MSCHGIIGQGSALLAKLEIGLAGLEKDFDVPSLVVDANDLSFAQIHICGDEGCPILSLVAVAGTDDPMQGSDAHLLYPYQA